MSNDQLPCVEPTWYPPTPNIVDNPPRPLTEDEAMAYAEEGAESRARLVRGFLSRDPLPPGAVVNVLPYVINTQEDADRLLGPGAFHVPTQQPSVFVRVPASCDPEEEA